MKQPQRRSRRILSRSSKTSLPPPHSAAAAEAHRHAQPSPATHDAHLDGTPNTNSLLPQTNGPIQHTKDAKNNLYLHHVQPHLKQTPQSAQAPHEEASFGETFNNHADVLHEAHTEQQTKTVSAAAHETPSAATSSTLSKQRVAIRNQQNSAVAISMPSSTSATTTLLHHRRQQTAQSSAHASAASLHAAQNHAPDTFPQFRPCNTSSASASSSYASTSAHASLQPAQSSSWQQPQSAGIPPTFIPHHQHMHNNAWSQPRRLRILRANSESPLIKLTIGLVRTYRTIRCITEETESRKRSAPADTDSHHTSAPYQHASHHHHHHVSQHHASHHSTKRTRTHLKNNGYDDENDDYIIRPNEIWSNRFEIQTLLGKGSFGQVVRAYDTILKRCVAIKIIKNRPSFTQQAVSEIRLLKLISQHDPHDANCVIHMRDHFVHRNHCCIVYDLMSYNLYEMLKQGHRTRISLSVVRKFAVQLLTGLRFLSQPSVSIIHCDLKPENIMLVDPSQFHIKIIDFGSSCHENQRSYSYIQSRYYRAPEVILGHAYTSAIDMWSLGCVLVELLTGDPLFAGSDSHDQLCRICDVLGMPPAYMIEQSSPDRISKHFVKIKLQQSIDRIATTNRPHNNQRHSKYILVPSKKFKPTHRSLRDIVQTAFEGSPIPSDDQTHAQSHQQSQPSTDQSNFLDLLETMLRFDPHDRIRPHEALEHPFFTSHYHHVSRSVNTHLTAAQPHTSS